MAGKAVLTCRPNSHLFQERTLVLDQPVKIGRSVARARPSSNNAIFDCKVLSRNHAVFWYTNGKFYLQDTKSSNGTFVNNQRLSKSGEESLPREVCSGDIVQFGVDVIENTRKVTHGCIIANIKLYLPDGKEAKASQSSSIISSNAVPVEDLYELHQYLQEASQREHMLETKLFALQEVLNSIKEAADQGWKALIAEDRLLTRVETLENQLQAYSKNFGEEKLKEELVKLQEEKNQYQCTAKEFLKKILDEKLEAVQKCQEVKRSLVNVEAAYSSLTDEMTKSHAHIQELAHKLSIQLAKNADAEAKIQELETKQVKTIERLENRNKELEKMLALRHAAEESLEKQLTDLRTAENIANEKAIAYELQLKVLSNFPSADLEGIEMNEGDSLDGLSLKNFEANMIETDMQESSDSFSYCKTEKGALNGGCKETNSFVDSELTDLKEMDSESSETIESCDTKEDSSPIIAKNSDNCLIAQERSEKDHKYCEECSVIKQALKEQLKLHSQYLNENSDIPDDFQNNLNKRNQEQEELLLRRQLLEAQQTAKQSRKEQAQMMDQIIALSAELESVNITDDNKIHEKLFESQQECNKLQNTISTLQEELMCLKEKCLIIDEENHLLQQKLDSYKKEKKFLNNKSEKQFEDILFKISRLEEELVIVGSKYMQCNEEKTKIARELANLKLDYQAISHQPYFNLIFALPCIMLVLAVTLAFYPTLSQIMGTAEHLDDGSSS